MKATNIETRKSHGDDTYRVSWLDSEGEHRNRVFLSSARAYRFAAELAK